MARKPQKATKPAKKPPQKTRPKAVHGDDGPLTEQQQLFVAEYIKDFNGSRSAIAAGYSEKTAKSQASRLLTYANVSQAIAAAMEERTKATKIDANWLLERLAKEAFADLADLYNEDGSLKPIHEWPKEWRTGLVAGVEIEEQYLDDEAEEALEPQGHGGALKRTVKQRKACGRIAKIKLSDRIKRLELIGRHVDVQAWKDKKEVSADEPLKQLFQQIAGNAIRPQQGPQDSQ